MQHRLQSGQTPDDVYYSPAKPAYENRDDKRIEDPKQTTVYSYEDRALRMQIYDRRWREFNDDYDYSYSNSPYYYSYYSYNNYGYYYNPYYCSRPLYYPTLIIHQQPVNTTPRMVNLNTYKNYNTAVAGNGKTYSGTNWVTPNSRQYNNSNNGGSRLGNLLRQVITLIIHPTTILQTITIIPGHIRHHPAAHLHHLRVVVPVVPVCQGLPGATNLYCKVIATNDACN
ncbi:MAG: hypothetical protein WDM90_00255 [Ferruginibacter sp.]